MGVIIGIIIFILGGVVGVTLMCLIQAYRINNAARLIKQFKAVMRHEKFIAAADKKSFEYIKGIDRVIEIYEDYWKEELQ